MDTSFKDVRLERLPAVLQRTGLKKSTVYKKVQAKEFPAPIPITDSLNHLGRSRASAWLAHEVDQWIADRVAKRVAPDESPN